MSGKHDVTRFIRSTFRSIWALELLCLLRKHADRDWPEAEIVAALRASDLVVSQNLAMLIAAGLVTMRGDGQVRYQPATPALDALVLASEALYARSPDAVRRLIVTSTTGDLTAFADAFRFRRD